MDYRSDELATLLVTINNARWIRVNKVKHNIWFDILKCPVQVCDMGTAFIYKVLLVDIAYGNNNLFTWWPPYSHVDTCLGFGIVISLDNLLDVVNVGCLERIKGLFDF